MHFFTAGQNRLDDVTVGKLFNKVNDNRAVYRRENKPRLTLAVAYIIRKRNYLFECKLPGQDKPRLEKPVNVDFVPFIRGVRVLCKPRLIFSRISGPNVNKLKRKGQKNL